jgi:hypothetical protein
VSRGKSGSVRRGQPRVKSRGGKRADARWREGVLGLRSRPGGRPRVGKPAEQTVSLSSSSAKAGKQTGVRAGLTPQGSPNKARRRDSARRVTQTTSANQRQRRCRMHRKPLQGFNGTAPSLTQVALREPGLCSETPSACRPSNRIVLTRMRIRRLSHCLDFAVSPNNETVCQAGSAGWRATC